MTTVFITTGPDPNQPVVTAGSIASATGEIPTESGTATVPSAMSSDMVSIGAEGGEEK